MDIDNQRNITRMEVAVQMSNGNEMVLKAKLGAKKSSSYKKRMHSRNDINPSNVPEGKREKVSVDATLVDRGNVQARTQLGATYLMGGKMRNKRSGRG